MNTIILPFQQRVFDEQTELKDKINKLESFFITSIFEGLTIHERQRLKRQVIYMKLYHAVLKERIEEFDSINE